MLNLVESRTADARTQTAALLAAVSPASLGREASGPHRRDHRATGRRQVVAAVAAGCALARTRALGRGAGRRPDLAPLGRRAAGRPRPDRASTPTDRELFIRSTAAGDRLGGLAPATRAAASALAAAFDVVVIETVGVGQSETEVADVADTVAVVVQPGSGDVLQFLKAGIMEVPDVLVVTKSDLGRIADRTVADLLAALRSLGAADIEVVAVSSVAPSRGSPS